jgi:hypothetical protein
VRLWLGKSHVSGDATADVFAGIGPEPIGFFPGKREASPIAKTVQVELSGPWVFYEKFWHAHDLIAMNTRRPEIAVQPNDVLGIPLRVKNNSDETAKVTASVVLPPGWKLKGHEPQVSLPPGQEGSISIPAIAPSQENPNFEEIRVSAGSGGRSLFQTSIFVKVDSGVAEQVK